MVRLCQSSFAVILLLIACVYLFAAGVSGVIHSPILLLFGLLFLNYWGEIHAFNVFRALSY